MPSLRFGTIGDNTIDQYYGAVSHSFVGGNAVNVAVQLRLLGNEVEYAGAVGADPDGDRVRAALSDRGIDVGGLVQLPGVTSISQIRVEPDGNRVIEFEDFATSADYRPDEKELDSLSKCSVVHIGMSPFAGEIRHELRRRGAVVSQDCAVSDGFDALDVAFCSAGEDVAAAKTMAEGAVGGGAALAVVTLGAEGSIAFDGDTWWSQPALPIDVVDTTGAGDSYIAGFLDSYARGASIPDCMRAGAATAAATCARLGAFEQDPRPLLATERRLA